MDQRQSVVNCRESKATCDKAGNTLLWFQIQILMNERMAECLHCLNVYLHHHQPFYLQIVIVSRQCIALQFYWKYEAEIQGPKTGPAKPDDAISSDVSCYSYSLLLEPSMCPSDVKIMVLRWSFDAGRWYW